MFLEKMMIVLTSSFRRRPFGSCFSSRKCSRSRSAFRSNPFSIPCVESLENRTLLSSVYHVAVAGNNAGDGSQRNPWQSLQHAADQVRAGDTVIVHAGQYAGFDLRTDGTAAERITFRADSGVVINQRNSRTTDGINLEGADYVTIQGFHIVGIPRAGIRSVVNHHVILQDNVADRNGVWGIFTAFSDDVLIENNVTSRSIDQHGIYVSNSGDRPIIRGNVSFGNERAGIHMNGDITSGGDGIISQALVEQNIIYDNGLGGAAGINADGVQDSRFVNNLLYNNHASGIALYRINGGGGSSRNTVVNNTIVQAADGRWGVAISDGSVSNQLFNNIIYNAHLWKGSVSVSADSRAGLVSDYNVVMNSFSTDNGDSAISLAAWRSATGQDLHSLIATAGELFVDPSAAVFHLKASSPAIDAGTQSLAPATDFEGDPRPQGSRVDIGADEFLQSLSSSSFAAGFDFGTSGSPVAAGYFQATAGTNYNNTAGYGWITSAYTGAKDRGGVDLLTRDSIYAQNRTFAVDVPAGTYDVTVTIGDAIGASDHFKVSLEGVEAGRLSAAAGQHVSGTYRVTVSDGQLTIHLEDLGGSGRYFYLNAIQVESTGAAAVDQTGPRVLSALATGSVADTLDRFRLTFSEPIPNGSLQLSQIKLTGPNGSIALTGISRINETTFDVHFPMQSAVGVYALTLAPEVFDAAGNRLDQDGDGMGGEVGDDEFRATAEVFADVFEAGFDFGTNDSPVAEGFSQVTPDTRYNASRGFGWTTAYWTGAKNRGGSNALTQDSNMSQMGTFVVDLPNGTYDVTITIGDELAVSDNLSVSLEGNVAGTLSASAGEHVPARSASK